MGDLADGPKLLIHAVASGRSVAQAIYRQFTYHSISTKDVELHFPVARYEREEDYAKVSRVSPSTLGVQERLEAQDRIVESHLPKNKRGWRPHDA